MLCDYNRGVQYMCVRCVIVIRIDACDYDWLCQLRHDVVNIQ